MLNFTKKTRTDKESKNLTIYNILGEKGRISRSDISAITKVNVVSISNYINEFIKKGLILEKQFGESSGGRPPVLLDLNREKVFAIGIHIYDSNILGILIDADMKIKNKVKKRRESNSIKEQLITIIDLLKKGKDDIFIKGIALVLENSDIDIPDLERSLGERYKIDLYIENPPICAAYAESVFGSIEQANKILYSHKDIGECVLLADFNFYTYENKDHEGFAYFRPWNRDMGIREYAKKIVEKGVGTEIIHIAKGSIDNITEKIIYDAARKNDNVAREILEFTGLNLGVRLAYLINVFKPQELILGGGIEQAGEYFIKSLKKSIDRLKEEALKDLKITNSVLSEESVAIGAACLVIRELFLKN